MENSALENRVRTYPMTVTRFLPSIICVLAGLFYLYEFVLQVSPSVMTTELMRDLQLNAASLGTMAAFYYYAYTPMQIPAGLLYDRFGPRVLITTASLICAAGAFFFGLTESVVMASAGRFFMGIGSAFAFIGSLVLVARWFPPKYFALLAGIVQLMSSLGAIVGQAPLAEVVERFGWRNTNMFLSVIGVLIAILVWLIVRDNPSGQQAKAATISNAAMVTQNGEMHRLRRVCSNTQTWWIALYSFTSWAPITAFAALWGVPYLVTAYGMTITEASSACSMIWLGIGIGSPLIGWWSDRIGRRCFPLTCASTIGVLSVFAILYVPHLPLTLVYILLFGFGLASAAQALSFGLVKDVNQHHVVGTAIGVNNMAVVAGGALFQPLVGSLLQMHWDGQTLNGAPVYSAGDYRMAMLILPLCYLLGAFISAYLLKESYCRSLYPIEGDE